MPQRQSAKFIRYSTMVKVKRGKKRREYIGLLADRFPLSLDELVLQVCEASGLAEAAIRSRGYPATRRVLLSAQAGGRGVSSFIVPRPFRPSLNFKWRGTRRETPSSPLNPLHSLYLDYLIATKPLSKAIQEAYPLTRNPRGVHLMILSRAEVEPLPNPHIPFAPNPLQLLAESSDPWRFIRQRFVKTASS